MAEIVNYSMGICSCYIACRLQDECGAPICLFSDTKREDEDTYRFGFEVAKRWSLDLRDASDGRDLWELFVQQGMIPARQLAMCSRILKIVPSRHWLMALEGTGRVAFGYDVDEEERADKVALAWSMVNLTPWFPLIEWGVSKAQCFGYFAQHGIAPPRIYQHFNHANCLPCKNFRENDWKALQFHYPEKFAEAREFETANGLRWMQDGPLLSDLPPIESAPSRKGRRKLAMVAPAFSFDMGCDRCAVD